MRIALAYGYWAQNIGNAFFNLGGHHQLMRASSLDETMSLFRVADNPTYWTLNRKSSGPPRNAVTLASLVDVDLLVLQGPQLNANSMAAWGSALDPAHRHFRIAYLGAGLSTYDHHEASAVQRFLEHVRPEFIFTRDVKTYETVKDCAGIVHSGIDSAFFVADAYTPATLTTEHIVVNFDRFREPHITIANEFAPDPRSWTLTMRSSRAERWIAARGQSAAFLLRSLSPGRRTTMLAGRPILRTNHRTSPPIWRSVYRSSSTMASDEPYSYLTAYANAAVTITDRVHAAVATIAYGRPVVYVTNTPRSHLLSRVGLDPTTTDRPQLVDAGRLSELKHEQVETLTTALEKVARS